MRFFDLKEPVKRTWLRIFVGLFTSIAFAAAGPSHAAGQGTETSLSQAKAPQTETTTTNSATIKSTIKPRQNQSVKIQGVSYATGVKLGMPIPVLIRAKALQQKLNAKPSGNSSN